MFPVPRIRRILFATDFLASSNVALDYAIAFAQHFEATVVMVHGLELSYPAREVEAETFRPSISRTHACQRLDRLTERVKWRGIRVETHVEEGLPSEVVLKAVDRYSADLLVLGVHGVHRGLAHLLIGSNTENILLSAQCPVMTVGAHVMAGVDPRLHFNEILYFSDLSAEAAVAAPYAAFLGREFSAPVDVCQLLPAASDQDPQLRHIVAEEYCDTLQRIHPEIDPAWCVPSFHLDHGRELDEVIERAQSQHAGLIVLGTHTESELGRHFHTSFAYQLLAKAVCPVISIRPSMSGVSGAAQSRGQREESK